MRQVLRFVFTTSLLLWSSVALAINASSIVATYFFTDHFTIASRHEVCEKPLDNRCVTHYMVSRAGGRVDDFVPFAYQFDRDYLVDGWSFAKDSRGFSYDINGAQKPWPYLESCVTDALLGLAGLIVWYFVGGPRVFKDALRTRWRPSAITRAHHTD